MDSGVTLNYLIHVLEQRRPQSIRIAALLDKPDRRLRPVHVTYVGFKIPGRIRGGVRAGLCREISQPERHLRARGAPERRAGAARRACEACDIMG